MGFKLLSFGVLCFALVNAAPESNPLSDSYIDSINSKQTTWKAGRNYPANTPLKHLKKLLGVPLYYLHEKVDHPGTKHNANLKASLPESFDSREKWSNCPSLNEIRDQGSCGSCWAFAAVEVMTDRICTYSNGTKNFHISARDLISCCKECGMGCFGGGTYLPWMYWEAEGIVSGGNYNSSEGCKPYVFPPCVHHKHGEKVNPIGDLMPCLDIYQKTPECSDQCDGDYPISYEKDKSYAKEIIYIMDGEEDIQAEIYQNGPVEAIMEVYHDFFMYKGGVYFPTDEEKIGGHAVKLLGWGVENGTKFWLAANSWNTHWGDQGFFKIRRGENDCNIETFITAGEPLFEDK